MTEFKDLTDKVNRLYLDLREAERQRDENLAKVLALQATVRELDAKAKPELRGVVPDGIRWRYSVEMDKPGRPLSSVVETDRIRLEVGVEGRFFATAKIECLGVKILMVETANEAKRHCVDIASKEINQLLAELEAIKSITPCPS